MAVRPGENKPPPSGSEKPDVDETTEDAKDE